MDELKITRVYPTEYAALTRLWEASVRATHDFLASEYIDRLRPLLQQKFLPMVSLLCARNAKGEIQGFIGVAGKKIEMLFIAPEARGKGVGAMLVNYVRPHIETLDVNEQNMQARGFYEKMGFKVIGRSETDGFGEPYPVLHLALEGVVVQPAD
jgi:putative acetyltransferase